MKTIKVLAFMVVLYALPSYAQLTNCNKQDSLEKQFMDLHSQRQNDPSLNPLTEQKYQQLALDYMIYSEQCYQEVRPTQIQFAEPIIYFDEGALEPEPGGLPEFRFNGGKWGNSGAYSTPGGTVTYSFMRSGARITHDRAGNVLGQYNNTAIANLRGYQPCFISNIVAAFAAWSAVANISFRQVPDNGASDVQSNNPANIRIGAHPIGGSSLAHAYNPGSVPTVYGPSGDVHFNSNRTWSCDASQLDIGTVAIHEIGHSIGLSHSQFQNAIMWFAYQSQINSLRSDDINGAVAIYGRVSVNNPSGNGTNALPAIIMLLLDDDDEDMTGGGL